MTALGRRAMRLYELILFHCWLLMLMLLRPVWI